MLKTSLKITLTLEGPLLTQSSSPGTQGLDAVICRNHKGEACLPGTLVSGKLRQAWGELDNASARQTWFQPRIDEWLGKRTEYDLPGRKRLFLSDFILEQAEDAAEKETVRHRIAIDPERGAVEEHQLVMVENAFVSGRQYSFSGDIHFFSPAEEEADTLIRHIVAGIKWFSQIGALRSVGYGRVVGAEVVEQKKPLPKPPALTPVPNNKHNNKHNKRISLCIEPQYPFCIARKKLANNLFETEAIISGGAMLGSIATTWNHLCGQRVENVSLLNDPDRKELQENFSNLRITHAFPGREKKRPVVAPLSLVRIAENDQLYDVALLHDAPCLIKSGKKVFPPDFAVEWKDKKTTLKGYPWPYLRMRDWGWPQLKTDLRVRTAIDRESLRSADEQLFSYERIIPDNQCWYAELDLSRIDKQQQGLVLGQLKSLLHEGVFALGKTKTPVKITFEETAIPPFFEVANLEPENGLWIVTLQTDTLLGCPEHLSESSGQNELRAMYSQAWEDLSEGALTMQGYFARQKLFGGWHATKRRSQGDKSLYRPWLLTEAGSVFILRAGSGSDKDIAAAQKYMTDWSTHGLPLSQTTCTWYGISKDSEQEQQWRQTPFIPQNGYGEIAVNMSGTPVEMLDTTSAEFVPISQIPVQEEV